ncbi:MAG: substrate-binding domain-containing protein [Verrucomicrobiota bacterium]
MTANLRTASVLLFATVFGGLSACKKSDSGVLQAGKFTVLGTRTDGADRAAAKANAENTLVRHPDIDAMIGLWAYNAPACLEALKAAEKTDQVKVFSFDEADAALLGIKDGLIEGTIVQQPYEFGYQSIKYLKDIHDGKTIEVPANQQIDIPAKTITKENSESEPGVNVTVG